MSSETEDRLEMMMRILQEDIPVTEGTMVRKLSTFGALLRVVRNAAPADTPAFSLFNNQLQQMADLIAHLRSAHRDAPPVPKAGGGVRLIPQSDYFPDPNGQALGSDEVMARMQAREEESRAKEKRRKRPKKV